MASGTIYSDWFLLHEVARSIATSPGWDASPSQEGGGGVLGVYMTLGGLKKLYIASQK